MKLEKIKEAYKIQIKRKALLDALNQGLRSNDEGETFITAYSYRDKTGETRHDLQVGVTATRAFLKAELAKMNGKLKALGVTIDEEEGQ